MSKQASKFQEKSMSLIYRGKEIFKPLNTGRIDERVSCVQGLENFLPPINKGHGFFLKF